MDSESTMELNESEAETESSDAAYDQEEVDSMLDALMEATDSESFAERSRNGRSRSRQRGVSAAQGRTAYREPAATGGYVTQKQFKEALERVGTDTRRNAEGIKTLNTRINSLDGRVDSVVSAATVHAKSIAKIEKQLKIGGALELVEALNNGGVNAFQLLKAAAVSGMLGDGKGALGNPVVIGGIGLLLRNPGILGGLGNLAPTT